MAEMAYGCGCLGFVGCQMAAPVTFGANRQKNADKKNIYLLFKVFCVAAFVGDPDSIPATRTPFRSLIPSVRDE